MLDALWGDKRKWTSTSPIISAIPDMIKKKIGLDLVHIKRAIMEQKIKQKGIDIGGNIRRVRMEKGLGQTELVRMLQLQDIDITRETLVKIERGIQHITGSQLRGIRDCLETSYDELLK